MGPKPQFEWARQYTHRLPVIRAQEDELNRRTHGMIRFRRDPTFEYRIWNEFSLSSKADSNC